MERNRVLLFVRVSSEAQDHSRQVNDLTAYVEKKGLSITKVIKEKISGAVKIKERTSIQELIHAVEKGEVDYIAITELSRLGRTREVLQLIEFFNEKKVCLLIQDLNLETLDKEKKPSFVSEILTSIINVMNKAERSSLIERVTSGIRAAKARGVHCGRSKGSCESTEKFLKKHSKIVRELKAGLSVRKIAKLYEVSPVTVMKVSNTLKQVTLKTAA